MLTFALSDGVLSGMLPGSVPCQNRFCFCGERLHGSQGIVGGNFGISFEDSMKTRKLTLCTKAQLQISCFSQELYVLFMKQVTDLFLVVGNGLKEKNICWIRRLSNLYLSTKATQ